MCSTLAATPLPTKLNQCCCCCCWKQKTTLSMGSFFAGARHLIYHFITILMSNIGAKIETKRNGLFCRLAEREHWTGHCIAVKKMPSSSTSSSSTRSLISHLMKRCDHATVLLQIIAVILFVRILFMIWCNSEPYALTSKLFRVPTKYVFFLAPFFCCSFSWISFLQAIEWAREKGEEIERWHKRITKSTK